MCRAPRPGALSGVPEEDPAGRGLAWRHGVGPESSFPTSSGTWVRPVGGQTVSPLLARPAVNEAGAARDIRAHPPGPKVEIVRVGPCPLPGTALGLETANEGRVDGGRGSPLPLLILNTPLELGTDNQQAPGASARSGDSRQGWGRGPIECQPQVLLILHSRAPRDHAALPDIETLTRNRARPAMGKDRQAQQTVEEQQFKLSLSSCWGEMLVMVHFESTQYYS
ncbi:hypothetical protein NDU88_006461 [Pleurodeles waltl]|uniref:Uncharacterized protein n=1 Tax=Pleurodeles waltl TaxID=8319 RepID=A0AAV7TEV3_PLEWA|nr:hypothetical protein NDU88_006461 [Pleurodeles waltl]